MSKNIHADAIKHLEANEHFQSIYLNDEGGWLFQPHPDYPHQLSRAEALGQKKEAPAPAPAPAAKSESIEETKSNSNKKK